MNCSRCNSPLEENDVFCKACGSPVEREPINQPPVAPAPEMMNDPVMNNQMANQNPIPMNNFNQNTMMNQASYNPAPMNIPTQQPSNIPPATPTGSSQGGGNTVVIVIMAIIILALGGVLLYFLVFKEDSKATAGNESGNNTGETNNGNNTSGGNNSGNNGGTNVSNNDDKEVIYGDFSLTIPKNWNNSVESNMLQIANSDNTVAFVIANTVANYDISVYESATDQMISQLESKGYTITDDFSKTINSKKMYVFDGTYGSFYAANILVGVETNKTAIVTVMFQDSSLKNEYFNDVYEMLSTLELTTDRSVAGSITTMPPVVTDEDLEVEEETQSTE